MVTQLHFDAVGNLMDFICATHLVIEPEQGEYCVCIMHVPDQAAQCDPTGWLAIDWGLPQIAIPFNLCPTHPLWCLPLQANPSFHARPSHIWIKDYSAHITVTERAAAVQVGKAHNLDGDLNNQSPTNFAILHAWFGGAGKCITL